MSNMFNEAGGSLQDVGSFGKSLMLPFGDSNPDAITSQFSVPNFGPGYLSGAGAGIGSMLGPGKGEPGWTGFGPGPYTEGYTGVGDRAYWGPLKSQSIASTSTGSVPDIAPAPPSAQWEDPSTASQGTSVAADADQIHPAWAQDFEGSSVDINAALPSESGVVDPNIFTGQTGSEYALRGADMGYE